MGGEVNELLEMLRNAEVTLNKELVGAVVDAELLWTSPDHSELLDAGRRQEGCRVYSKEHQKGFHKKANHWNKQNQLHQ